MMAVNRFLTKAIRSCETVDLIFEIYYKFDYFYFLKFIQMKKSSVLILSITVAFLAFSCKKYDLNGKEIIYKELYKAQWLIGEWQKTDSIGTLTETWKTLNDSTFSGTSYFVINKDKDTVHSETIELMEDKEHLIYTATVVGQNNDEPVPFQMTEIKDSLLVFTNPKHDFPQKIQYKLNKDSSILATISGKIKGKENSESYLMQKK